MIAPLPIGWVFRYQPEGSSFRETRPAIALRDDEYGNTYVLVSNWDGPPQWLRIIAGKLLKEESS